MTILSQITAMGLVILSGLHILSFYQKSKCSFIFYQKSFKEITRSLHSSVTKKKIFSVCQRPSRFEKKTSLYLAKEMWGPQEVHLKINGTISNDSQ